MAPKTRENLHFGPGQGRKTGITLAEGERDEHGFEKADNLFSSPEKPTERRGAGVVTTSSEAMDIQQSSAPEPTETLSVRKALRTSTKTVLPPPKGRSPIKTALGSSPRRQSSIGPPSRVLPRSTPNRVLPTAAVQRRLFDDDGSEEMNGVRGGQLDDIYTLQPSPARDARNRMAEVSEEEDETPIDPILEESTANGYMPEDDVNGLAEPYAALDDAAEPDVEDELPVETPVPARKGGRKRKSEALEELEADARPPKAAKNATAKRGARKPIVAAESARPVRRTRRSLDSSAVHNDSTTVEDSDVALAPSGSRQGRSAAATGQKTAKGKGKAKAQDDNSVLDEQSEVEPRVAPKPKGANATKRGRQARDESSMLQPEQQEASASTMMPPPQKRRGRPPKDANRENEVSAASSKAQKTAKVAKGKGSQADVFKAPAKPTNKVKAVPEVPAAALERTRVRSASVAPSNFSTMSTRSRSNVMYREMTPANNDVNKSRTGRVLRAPRQFWLGEKDEFAYDGELVAWTEAEIVQEEKRVVNRRKRQRKQPALQEIAEEQMEPWEVEDHYLTGLVNMWDAANGQESGRRQEEDVAFASTAIETRLVDGTSFEYTRICGVNYFNMGLVKIPPGGQKTRKNSRRMHMIFYVLQGPVEVTVGENLTFTINAGGVWQVPRGNFYSIANVSDDDAKMLFAQAHNEDDG